MSRIGDRLAPLVMPFFQVKLGPLTLLVTSFSSICHETTFSSLCHDRLTPQSGPCGKTSVLWYFIVWMYGGREVGDD